MVFLVFYAMFLFLSPSRRYTFIYYFLSYFVILLSPNVLALNRGRDLSVTRGVEFSVFGSCVAFSRVGPVFS